MVSRRCQVNALATAEEKRQFCGIEHEVLSRPPGKNQVKVAMETPGRLLGTTWFLDADAFVQ
jgi:hypothetical protein